MNGSIAFSSCESDVLSMVRHVELTLPGAHIHVHSKYIWLFSCGHSILLTPSCHRHTHTEYRAVYESIHRTGLTIIVVEASTVSWQLPLAAHAISESTLHVLSDLSVHGKVVGSFHQKCGLLSLCHWIVQWRAMLPTCIH